MSYSAGVFVLCLLGIVFHGLDAQICKPPPNAKIENIPDIFALSKKSYSWIVEANYNQLGKTHYVTELYDREKMRGKLNIEIDGEVNTVVYFNGSNEYFEANGGSCKSSKLSNLVEADFNQKFEGWNWVNTDPKETIVGPSNMFRKAFLQQKEGTIAMFREPKQEVVRGITTDVWTWCHKEGKADLKIQFHFSDPINERPYGYDNMAIPMRVKAEGTWNSQTILEYFEFVGLQLDVEQRKLDLEITIPFFLGCKRQATELKPTPDFAGKSIYVDAELVYTPITNNPKGFSYTTNFKIAGDMKDNIMSIDYAPWKSHKDEEMAKPGDDLFRVYDYSNLFEFNIDLDQGTCDVRSIKENFSTIILPDGSEIDYGKWDLFVVGSKTEEYHYLGETVERGIPASVFEKTVLDGNGFAAFVVTRFHVSDTVVEENIFKEKQAPLKVVVWRTDVLATGFLGKLEVNLYNYASQVPKKHEQYDVSTCFPATDQSKWFQIIFPMEDHPLKDVIPIIPFIHDNYWSILDSFGGKIPPYRIPKFMVDADKDNLYLTAQLLERPDFKLDFEKTPGKTFRADFSGASRKGITSVDGCAKHCINSPICTYFTYCGALCTIVETEVNFIKDIVDNSGCDMYMNLKDDNNAFPMDMVTSEIARNVAAGQFKIGFTKPDGSVLEFKAAVFRDNIAFGLNGLVDKPAGFEENHFSVYKYGYKMVKSVADEGSNQGRLSLASCQQSCINKETCETFSYCLATLECLLSSKHGDQIPDNQFEASTQCTTSIRSYQDRFEEFPGLSLNHEAEKFTDDKSIEGCARSCIQETGFNCKSFDFCPGAEKDKEKPCWLHKEHFGEIQEANHVNIEEECGHYSRKYMSDFSQQRHKDISASESSAVLLNVSAEDCARSCKDNVGFQCTGFDYCLDPFTPTTTCTLRRTFSDKDFVDKTTCNAYVRNPEEKKKEEVKKREKREVKEEGHSKSATGGLGFLMLLIGLGLGVGGIYGYGYWRANRNRNS